MRGQKVLFSSEKDDWETPPNLFDSLNKEFGPFTLDPCASEITAKCENFYTKRDDGLRKKWAPRKAFMNPPYGGVIGKWFKKAYNEAKKGALVVGLVPARTDTKYFHEFVWLKQGVIIRLIKGRVFFVGGGPAPFPSAIVIWHPHLEGEFGIGIQPYEIKTYKSYAETSSMKKLKEVFKK